MSSPANSLPRLTIRSATSGDVFAAVPVINEAFAIETFLEGTRTDETRIAEMMQDGEFLVAVEDASGRIVGSVYVETRGERGYFGMLAVDPSRQGTGLGRKMVEAAEERCRQQGCKHIDITVLSLRPELLPFYRKLGYREAGTEEFHPSRPLSSGVNCQCIVMSKSL